MYRIKYIIGLITALLCLNNSAFALTNVSSWADLKTQTESGESVNLNADINAEGTLSPVGASIININGNLKSIDALNAFQIINNSVNLVVNEVNFSRAHGYQGGVIYNQSVLKLIMVNCSNSSAWDGGALYLAPTSETEISGSSFSSNTSNGHGAAIYNKGSLLIDDSDFTGNAASSRGGAIYNEAGLNIIGGNFEGNSGWDGGALYLTNTSIADIKDAEFDSNTASGHGAAIYNEGSLTISNTDFLKNQSSSKGGAIYSEADLYISGGSYSTNSAWDGGALYLKPSSETEITGAEFSSNTSNGHGAAIYNQGSLTINTSNFTSNKSSANGGAIYNEAILNITGGSYSGNSAWDGGALFLSSTAKTEITGAGLKANKIVGGYGGAVYNLGELKITDATLGGVSVDDGNSSVYRGGAIYNEGKITSISNTKFVNNVSSTEDGGAIYNETPGIIDKITLSEFNYNKAGDDGGAIYNLNEIKEISSTKFSNNEAVDSGSAINNRGIITKIIDSEFNSNKSNNEGGAITNIVTIAEISNSKFNSNTSVGDKGGAIYNDGSITALSGSEFVSNSSKYEGGAIFNRDSISQISGTRFNSNSSLEEDGGAIYNESSISGISGSEFTSNKAKSEGGAIYNEGTITEILGTTFSSNIAESEDGGGIFNETNATIDKISASQFDHNKSGDDGAAVHNLGTIKEISNTKFLYNEAVDSGGAVDNRGIITKFLEAEFTSNVSGNEGGAVSNRGSISGIINSKFISNSTTNDRGGAIYNDGSISSISGSEFSSNTSKYEGGAIYNKNLITEISSSTFSLNNSEGYDGGAIFNETTGVIDKISLSEFSHNKSGDDGGAIHNAGTITEILSTKFLYNEAPDSGGAIYNENLISNISGSEFSFNSSDQEGGAIYNKALITDILSTKFISNDSSAYDGGAVFNQTAGTIDKISSSEFNYNKSGDDGGAIYNEGTIKEISSTTFAHNEAPDSGGAIDNRGTINKITGSDFVSNVSGYEGGAISNRGTITEILNSKFNSNISSDDKGAAIYNEGLISNISGSEFVSNSSKYEGSAIYNKGTININSSDFKLNQTTYSGGAIYNEAQLRISRGLYSENSGWDGGAIYLNPSSVTSIEDAVFSLNRAIAFGGAIYNAGDLTLSSLSNGVTFLENSSTNGGAVYNSNKLTINGATFGQRTGSGTELDPYVYSKGNTIATSDGYKGGGAIYNSTGTVNISGNTSFFDNKAVISGLNLVPSGGGAIYNNSGTMNILASGEDRVVFQKNTSTSGGAIFNSGGNLTITNALFGAVRSSAEPSGSYVYSGGNTATATGNYQGGGAIYNSGTLNISGNTNFYGNTANINDAPALNGGGAIYTNAGTVTVTSDVSDIIFAGNKATRGGAIYNNFGTVNLKATNGNIKFIDNEATLNGGAIYNIAAAINMYAQGGDIIFSNNLASNLGASIYNDQGTLNLRTQSGNKIVFDDPIYNYSGSSQININQNDGTEYLGTIEVNNRISGVYDPIINLYNGVLKLGHTVNSDGTTLRSTGIISDNVLNLHGGTIDMIDGMVGNYISTQNMSIAKDSSIGLKLDVNLSNSTSDYISLSNPLINSGSGTSNGVFRIDGINLLKNASSSSTNITLFTGSNAPSVSQIIGTTVDTTLFRYIVTQNDSAPGQLLFTRLLNFDELYTEVKSEEIIRTLSVASNVLVSRDLNEMLGTNGRLTVNGNGHSIDGQGYNGVIVSADQTYNINNVSIYSDFVSTIGGAVKNAGVLNISDTTLMNNFSSGNGGAIYNTGIATLRGSSSIINNSSAARGGAIYSEGTFKLIADTGDITISGNSDSNGTGIYLKGGQLELNSAETKKITISDKIESEDNTTTISVNNGTENNNGTIVINADMSGYKGSVDIYGGVLQLGTGGVFFGSAADKIALSVAETATLNLQNNKIDTIYASSYTGGGRFLMDVDLFGSKSDSLVADIINQTSSVNISGIQLLSDNVLSQSIRMFSDGIDVADFSIIANTSGKRYLITKDADKAGFIYVEYIGDVGDGLIAQLEATGVRSYSQTNAQYTATLNLPSMNAAAGQTNILEVFGQNKTISGDNMFSLFKVDTQDPETSEGTARELIIHDALITNATGTNGSAVFVNGKGAQATLENVNVSNNQSSSNGGAISVTEGASLTINGGVFSNNTAASNGGAIYLKGNATDPSVLTIISSINNTVFENNMANLSNNSIYMAGDSILNVNNSLLAKLILAEGIATSGDNNVLNINKQIGSAPTNGSFDITSDFSNFKGNNNQVNLYNGSISLKSAGTFFGNTGNSADYINLSIKNNAVLNFQNNKIDTVYVNSFETEGSNTLAKFDIDLALHKVDKIVATSVIGSPVLNVDTFNIISNAVTDSLFDITSSNIQVNYAGGTSYYTSDYSYQVKKDSDSNSIRFVSEYIGGDGLKRVLKNIGVRTYSMVIDSEGKPENYIATENLPELNAEFAEGRENRVTIFGNGGTISGAEQYRLFRLDSTLDGIERELRLDDVTLKDANSSQCSALFAKGKSTVVAKSVVFENNVSSLDGGAVYLENGSKLTISGNSQFKNNTSSSKGGAVYMKGSDSNNTIMTVTSDTSKIEFTGNKQNNTENNAIYMAGNSILNLKASSDNNSIIFNDSIKSEGLNNKININAPDESSYKGKVAFNADMSGYANDIGIYDGTLNLKYPNMKFNTSSFKMYENATLDLRNSLVDSVSISNLQFDAAKANLGIDIDGQSQKADTIEAPGTTGTFNITNFNILTDSSSSKTGPILISKTEGLNVSTDPNVAYLGPIYKYFITSSGGQSVVLNRNYSDSFNPVVYSSPVNSTVGTYSNVMNTYNQAFTNSDIFMMQSHMQRLSYRLRNRYAINEVDSSQRKVIYPELISGPWYRPYTTFESVGLKNGPNVSNTSYGSFVGYDMPLEEVGHGFQSVLSAYVGYNGSNQSYEGVHINQNGGLFGFTKSFFKDNFFTSLTANVSASSAHSSSPRSSSDFTTLATGIATKTGYNIELGESKCIIQPSVLLTYSFIKTFDYRDTNGINYSSDGLNVLQINPGVKFIANLKGIYQPYIAANMVWSIMNDGKFKANDISIPMVSVRPYMEYGVGLQKRFGERLTGYFQSMVRSGGRNGIALQFGFKWAI